MTAHRNRRLSLGAILVLCFIILTLLPTLASSEETYVFERMWPTLHQPWDFGALQEIVVNADNNLYATDTSNRRIQKFISDGVFIIKWENKDSGDGEFIETGNAWRLPNVKR